MAFSVTRRFELGLAWRALLFGGALWLLFEALRIPDLRAGRIVSVLVVAAAGGSLWAFIRRTNFQVARFIESVRFEDYSQRFSDPSGGGFDVLGEALDRALKSLGDRQRQSAEEARYLAAIVDDAPNALIAIEDSGRVKMLNKAARSLFATSPVTQVDDLAAYGPELDAAVRLPAGTRKITRLTVNGVPQKAVLASAHLARLDAGVTIISILPVQSELGSLELAAQADLVRVLTHEIMNSLTPVTSLARTGAELVAAIDGQGETLMQARIATDTVARRAEGILRFVESYREFAQSPEAHRRNFQAKPWADDLLRLAQTQTGKQTIDAAVEVSPATLKLNADPELLGQAVLNLLRNAIRAVGSVERPVVRLRIKRLAAGHFRISVSDNGPGIPPDRRDDIFLPFYTTHKGGSGVGLSFARQVALAHGGSIDAAAVPEGGAHLQIVI